MSSCDVCTVNDSLSSGSSSKMVKASPTSRRAERLSMCLTCPLCKNLVDEPRILPCLHTYCTNCIQDYMIGTNVFVCLECRRQVDLRGKSTIDLPTNSVLSTMVKIHNILTGKTDVQCEKCTNSTAIARCVQCKLFLCENDAADHLAGFTSFLHKIISLEEVYQSQDVKMFKSRNECTKHPGEELLLYCTQCIETICTKCTIEKHQGHNDVLRFEDAIEIEKEGFLDELEKLEMLKESAEGLIVKAEEGIQVNVRNQKVKKGFLKELRGRSSKDKEKSVKKKEGSILEDARRLVEKEEVERGKHRLMKSLKEVNYALSLAKVILEEGSDVDILEVKKTFVDAFICLQHKLNYNMEALNAALNPQVSTTKTKKSKKEKEHRHHEGVEEDEEEEEGEGEEEGGDKIEREGERKKTSSQKKKRRRMKKTRSSRLIDTLRGSTPSFRRRRRHRDTI